jgi:hypothetical protein
MSRWRRFHYCASAAVIVTSLGVFFDEMGGELILIPGLIAQGVLELILTLLVTAGDDFYSLPGGSHAVLAAIFYFTKIYAISFGWTFLKEGKS